MGRHRGQLGIELLGVSASGRDAGPGIAADERPTHWSDARCAEFASASRTLCARLDRLAGGARRERYRAPVVTAPVLEQSRAKTVAPADDDVKVPGD
jgi:hypothetical protein